MLTFYGIFTSLFSGHEAANRFGETQFSFTECAPKNAKTLC